MFISSRRRHDRRRAAGRVALRRSSLVGVPCICCDECGAVEMDRAQSQVLAPGEQTYTAPHRRAGSERDVHQSSMRRAPSGVLVVLRGTACCQYSLWLQLRPTIQVRELSRWADARAAKREFQSPR